MISKFGFGSDFKAIPAPWVRCSLRSHSFTPSALAKSKMEVKTLTHCF